MLNQTIKTISFALALSATLSGGLEAETETLLYHREGNDIREEQNEKYDAETKAYSDDRYWSRVAAEKAACDNARRRARNLGGTRFSLCTCSTAAHSSRSFFGIGSRYTKYWGSCRIKYSLN